jgi:hypothetical protein
VVCIPIVGWRGGGRIGPVSGGWAVVGVPGGGVMDRLNTELVGEDAADEVGVSSRLEGTGDNGVGTTSG